MGRIAAAECVARGGGRDGVACAGGRCERRGLTNGVTLVFAAACGLSVANIYYAHPLLDAMARDLGVDPGSIGIVVTLTQVGYALGLIFVVPLGDLVDRRRLVVGQGVASAFALGVIATARTPAVFLVAMSLVGLLAVAVQVLVSFAATLAAPEARGRVVGRVTGGVVVGILAARVVAGVLADLGGWRAVYLTSAVCTLGMAGLLHRVLPAERDAKPVATGYVGLLRSMLGLFRREPVLRVRAVLALLIFAAFSTLWTSLVFPLAGPPRSLSHTEVGLFGLVGLMGALAAGGAGRLADRGLGRWTTGTSLALLVASWALIAALPRSIPSLVAGVLLLDLAVQAVHVTNQSVIFGLGAEARSRLVGGYMVFYSVGSAVGASASTAAYARAGWPGVCVLGATFSAAALVFWAGTLRVDAGRAGAGRQNGTTRPS